MIVEDYWTGIARRLQVESGAMNGLIPHMLERGVANEISLARVVENLVPPSIGVGSGIIFDHQGNASAQTDLILFDRSSQPQLMAQTTQVMFPIETVRMAVEVKTTLAKNDIEVDFPKKRAKLDALVPLDQHERPPFALFAYAFADSNFSRASELSSLAADKKPDLACVIDPGFLKLSSGDTGFVPLRDPKSDPGEPDWYDPSVVDHDGSVTVDGFDYPAFTMGVYSGTQYLGDPGRALLLFCLEMLTLLDREGHFDWVASYTSKGVRALLAVEQNGA